METTLKKSRPHSAPPACLAALGALLLATAAPARPEAPAPAAPVVDPLDAVLDPNWKPPAPPAPPPAQVQPAAVAPTGKPAAVQPAPQRERREDAPGYQSLFNASELFPGLEKGENVGLLAGAGLATIDDATHGQLAASLYFTGHVILGGVLNHALASTNPAYPKGKNRLADFDEWRDWFRLIQRWDSPLDGGGSFKLGRLANASQGESGLLQNLNNDLLADTPRMGVSLEVRRTHWWLAALLSDATWLAPVAGGQLGFIPAGGSDSDLLSSIRISGYYAGDFAAPTSLVHTPAGPIAVEEEHRPKDKSELLHGFGADLRVRPLDTEHLYADLYGAFNQLLGQGNGLHAGLRLGARSEVTSIELRGEARLMGAHYLPHYFDSFYDVQRSSFLSGQAGSERFTKLGYLRSLDRDGRVQSFLAGARLTVGGLLGVEATYETGGEPLLRTATLHAQVNAGEALALFATYQRRNFGDGGSWFNFEPNELLVGRIRLQASKGFFLTGYASRTFVWDPAAGGEGAYKAAWSGGAQALLLWGG